MRAGALHPCRYRCFRPAAGRFLTFAGGVAVVSAATSCDLQEPPDLLSVHRVEPSRASAGDRIVIKGEGFPAGRPATATFRGDLFRPGSAPETDARIVLPAAAADRNALVVAFDQVLERRFAGSGSSAAHTTFHGDVRVVFEPRAAGLAPVSGTLHDVRFDVLPSVDAARSDAIEPEPHRSLAFLGARASSGSAAGGLRLTAVDPEGRAASAGFITGDVITEFDGVTVITEDDLRPRGGERVASVVVERGGRTLPPSPLDVEGLAPRAAADLVGSAAAVLVPCALIGVPATRLGVLLRWFARLGECFRSPRAIPRPPGFARGIAAALLPPTAEWRVLGAAAFVVLAGGVLAFMRLAFGHSLLSPDLDLAAFALGSQAALFATRVADGGCREGKGWSLVAALGSGGRALACLVPALAAIGGAVLSSGRFVIGEMVADQGGAPWRWAAMRNPGLFALLVILLSSAVPEGRDPGSLSAEGFDGAGRTRSSTRTLLRLAEWGYLWITCGLAVALFLGGWRVPGVASLAQEANRSLTGLGALLFLLKLWAVALGVGALRRAAGRIAVEHVAVLALRWALPAAALAVAIAAGWTALLDGARFDLAADLAGYASVALSAALLLGAGVIAILGKSRPVIPSTVNPWL